MSHNKRMVALITFAVMRLMLTGGVVTFIIPKSLHQLEYESDVLACTKAHP
jgi:hypothetical protein